MPSPVPPSTSESGSLVSSPSLPSSVPSKNPLIEGISALSVILIVNSEGHKTSLDVVLTKTESSSFVTNSAVIV